MKDELEKLKKQLKQTQKTLGTLISWIAQSSNSPLSVDNAEELLKMLQKTDRK